MFIHALVTGLQPARHPMEVGGEAAKKLHRLGVAICGYRYLMFCTPDIDSSCIQIQGWESFRRITFLAFFLCLLPCFG
jgi:hypothetical protein